MRYISEENLKKWILHENCDEGCGYIDERDIESMEWEEIDDVFKDIKQEIAYKKEIHDKDTHIERVKRCEHCKYKDYVLESAECGECLRGIKDYYVPEGD